MDGTLSAYSVQEHLLARSLCQIGTFTLAWRKVWGASGAWCSVLLDGVMQQPTSRQLYAYWDHRRNGRIAPRRFEIEPAKIASLLPETFIAEGAGLLGMRFRLAGTISASSSAGSSGASIFSRFGRQGTATRLPPCSATCWSMRRLAMASSLPIRMPTGRRFEFILLPLIHTSETINRLLGSITAIEPAFWLGSEPLTRLEIAAVGLHWPDGTPAFASRGAEIIRLRPQRFCVLAGRAARTWIAVYFC